MKKMTLVAALLLACASTQAKPIDYDALTELHPSTCGGQEDQFVVNATPEKCQCKKANDAHSNANATGFHCYTCPIGQLRDLNHPTQCFEVCNKWEKVASSTNPENPQCVDCPLGYIQDKLHHPTQCIEACKRNEKWMGWQTGNKGLHCSPCPAGQVHHPGDPRYCIWDCLITERLSSEDLTNFHCVPCPAGEIRDPNARTKCTVPCPFANEFFEKNSMSCELCPAHKTTHPTDPTKCTCDVGQRENNAGDACICLHDNERQNQLSAPFTCIPCLPGQTVPPNDPTKCECAPGQKVNPEGTHCICNDPSRQVQSQLTPGFTCSTCACDRIPNPVDATQCIVTKECVNSDLPVAEAIEYQEIIVEQSPEFPECPHPSDDGLIFHEQPEKVVTPVGPNREIKRIDGAQFQGASFLGTRVDGYLPKQCNKLVSGVPYYDNYYNYYYLGYAEKGTYMVSVKAEAGAPAVVEEEDDDTLWIVLAIVGGTILLFVAAGLYMASRAKKRDDVYHEEDSFTESEESDQVVITNAPEGLHLVNPTGAMPPDMRGVHGWQDSPGSLRGRGSPAH